MVKKKRARGAMLVTGLALAMGCGRAGEGDDSTASFAHWRAESTLGGPMGRLIALRQNFPADFRQVKVCVEQGHPTLSDADVMLETKLAFAAWLDASKRFSEADWNKVAFIGQSECRPDSAWGALISFGKRKVTQPARAAGQFAQARMSCQASGASRTCRMESLTLGFGGPGLMTPASGSAGRRWTMLSGRDPSFTFLSPHVDWLTLEAALIAKPATALPSATKNVLLSRLRALRSTPSPSWANLIAFMAQLKAAKAVANEDPIFSSLSGDFLRGGSEPLSRIYRPRYVAFHTLIHEVGHQMGMDHSDAPDPNSTTGVAPGAQRASGGVWVNAHAAMAYGDPYLYLTDDDAAGAASNARGLEALMASHH